MKSALVRAAQFAVYAGARTVERLLRLLPLPRVYRLGALLGTAAGFVFPSYRHLVDRNLAIAFEVRMSPADRRRLRRAAFARLGGNLASSVRIMSMPSEALRDCVEVDLTDSVLGPHVERRAFILAILHMGCWEILARLPDVDERFRGCAALYQPLSNPFIDRWIKRTREAAGVRMIDRRDGFAEPSQVIREGGGIGVLVDQHAGDKGVWCPLFGRLASTSSLAALLAARTGAALIPTGVETLAPGRWRLVLRPPVIGDHAAATTAILNRQVESLVEESPADWFWMHRRWKTPRPNFLLRRYRRGITLPPDMATEDLRKFRIIVRSPNWLGDACMAVPAVRAIARGRPDAEVTILCPENLVPLWETVGGVTHVIGKQRGDSIFRVGRSIRRHGTFDAGILLPNSLRSALELRMGAVPEIVGYAGRWRSRLLTKVIRTRRRPGPVEHHSQSCLALARELGAEVEDTEDHLFGPLELEKVRDEDREQPGRHRLAVCPGAEYGPAKRWPAERFGEVCRTVAAADPSAEIVLFGVAGDAEIGQAVASQIEPGRCRNRIGATSLSDLMHELAACSVLLTNDTGTMHLAALLGVPVVAVFGSTDPAWTGPLGSGHAVITRHAECSPCFLRKCPLDLRCMHEIDTARVVDAILTRLPSRSAAA